MSMRLLAVLLCSAPLGAGAAPVARFVEATVLPGIEKWSVTRDAAPALDVYVAHGAARKPLVVLVQGSQCYPLFLLKPKRTVSTLFVPPDELASQAVGFAMIERRGLRSFGPAPASDEEARALGHCTATHGGVDKAERVADVLATVEALAKQPWVGPVFLLGHSEGADVVAGVARIAGPQIAAVGLLSGAGATRFFDDIAIAHRHGDLTAVKRSLDDLIALTGPAPPAEYAGAASVRQLSYAVDSTPLDDMRGTKVPVFVAGGTADEHAPIESADLFVAELLRARTRSVHYVVLPKWDHGLNGPDGTSHAMAVVREFVRWATGPRNDRSVSIGLAP
ncbi:MAG: hypothetical protein ABI321_23395 [Polyangia bacterium]